MIWVKGNIIMKKKRHFDADSKYTICAAAYTLCNSVEYFDRPSLIDSSKCQYLYLASYSSTFKNKYVFDRWVTTIIFSCFIAVCCIGLAVFGFLLFKSDSSGI